MLEVVYVLGICHFLVYVNNNSFQEVASHRNLDCKLLDSGCSVVIWVIQVYITLYLNCMMFNYQN